MQEHRILCAGFGGQGVMTLGQLLAYGGMLEEKQVTWLPSYGPEMRGGTAYCSVVISDRPVGMPIVTRNATCAIVMNLPSLQKFANSVVTNGLLLINASLIKEKPQRCDITCRFIPATALAERAGDRRSANMVMLGACLELSGAVLRTSVSRALAKVFGDNKAEVLRISEAAIDLGITYVRDDKQSLAA